MASWPRRRWAFGFGAWSLPVLLLIAVVVPSACVLWFMNEAVEHQAAATRQAIADAYRGQLRLVRARLVSAWQSRTEAMNREGSPHAAVVFKTLITNGAADSVIVLGNGRAPVYPALLRTDVQQTDPAASGEQRLGQAAVRDLVRTGNTRGAIDAIGSLLASRSASRGTDAQGRLLAAGARLLLINLLGPGDRRRAVEIQRLAAMVNDYEVPLPSAQRAFLMEQLRSLDPQTSLPTFDAEQLALTFLERDRPAEFGRGLQATAIPELWQCASTNGRVVGLYHTATIVDVLERELKEASTPDVAFRLIAPDQPGSENAIAIGTALPGWEVTFATDDRAGDASQARSRRNRYLSIAAIAIVLIVAAAIAIGGAARRQARLASLKTDLVSAVSHELKTPLASMRLLVDTLLEDDAPDPRKTREYLQLMAVENARLTRLIDNFLTFSRLERRRQRFAFAPTDPADIVHDALAAMPEERRREHPPHVEIAPDLPPVIADQDAMVTVLVNLLDNAYKYTPDDKRITVRVSRESGQGVQVVFAVEDNGIGIPVREQKRIFRRFYRVDRRLARETTGSGLGLSIVDAIVRAHGGTVRVDSRPEQGSTFTVLVPCATEAADA
jgi:signal transduction histidine kinase